MTTHKLKAKHFHVDDDDDIAPWPIADTAKIVDNNRDMFEWSGYGEDCAVSHKIHLSLILAIDLRLIALAGKAAATIAGLTQEESKERRECGRSSKLRGLSPGAKGIPGRASAFMTKEEKL